MKKICVSEMQMHLKTFEILITKNLSFYDTDFTVTHFLSYCNDVRLDIETITIIHRFIAEYFVCVQHT